MEYISRHFLLTEYPILSMTFLDPIWLLLLAPLVAIWMRWRQSNPLLNVLRGIVLLLVLLALSRPTFQWSSGSGTVVVVADRSASISPENLESQDEVIRLLHESMGPRDSMAVVSFGEHVALEKKPGREEFSGFQAINGADQSRLSDAITMGLSALPADQPGRILALTDGLWTGSPLTQTLARAASQGTPIDFRDMSRVKTLEIGIQSLKAPQKALPGEGFLINAWVSSSRPSEVQYRLKRNQQVISSGTQSLNSGANRLLFRDRADSQPGLSEYTLEIIPPEDSEDATPENNVAETLLQIQGPLPLLHISDSGDQSGLAKLLRAGGVELVSQTPGSMNWTLEGLGDFAGVILENVSANSIGSSGMATLASWVEETGKGLLMTGGTKSFGPGGYFQSPIDPLLPVSMELRQEHRKFNLAIAVVLDRSGSMQAPVGDGRVKMDLANIGTAQVLDLLSATDEIGVIAVDSSPHVIVDLDTVGVNQSYRSKIMSMESMGGGIFVYEGLKAAAGMLIESKSENRHIILFSDAADSEEPGDYIQLLEHCKEAGITVSVVGLGTARDSDAMLLMDIADRGEGNIYFTSDANEIPRLFAQDTFSVARSSMVEEPTPIQINSSILSIGGEPDWNPPPLGGYNLCYIKPQANLGAMTLDEYSAPAVASWQAGVGRVATFTGEADGKLSGEFAQWSQVGDFFATLARWVAGDGQKAPEGIWVTQTLEEGACQIELHLDPSRQGDPFSIAPNIRILRGDRGAPPIKQTHTFEWKDADTLEATLPLSGYETLIATVDFTEINGTSMSLPPVRLPYSPEYKPEWTERGSVTLNDLASKTGGKERTELSSIWSELPVQMQSIELAPWALGIAAVLFFMEILERRMALLTRLNWNPRKVAAQSISMDEEESIEEGAKVKESKMLSWIRSRTRSKSNSKPTTAPITSTNNLKSEEKPAGSKQQSQSPTPPQAEKGSALTAMKRARQKAQSRTRRDSK